MNAEFWRNRRVLVTGHTGFKGGWLCLWLTALGAKVTGFSLAPSTHPNLYDIARIGEDMEDVRGDIRDLEAVCRVVATAAPEVIFHMAAQPLVRQSYARPVDTYSTNVMGTVHVLEAVRCASGVRVLVNITSDKCYENRGWTRGYCEDDAMGGHDPYSSSKGCAELVTAAFRNSYFSSSAAATNVTAIASARAGNVIGGGDWSANRLIPDIIRAIAAQQPVSIRNPGAIRPWQHVLEPVSGYLLLAQSLYESKSDYASAWNFGPADDEAKPVSWIVERLTQHWGQGASWRVDDGSHPHEAAFLRLDSSKARAHLGWRPKFDLDSALRSLVDWYKSHAAGADMKQVTLNEIESYVRAN